MIFQKNLYPENFQNHFSNPLPTRINSKQPAEMLYTHLFLQHFPLIRLWCRSFEHSDRTALKIQSENKS